MNPFYYETYMRLLLKIIHLIRPANIGSYFVSDRITVVNLTPPTWDLNISSCLQCNYFTGYKLT